MASYYNFLPPFDQIHPNESPFPPSIGDINRLDPYLPPYNITSGTLTPLGLTGQSLQQPANINGTQGPTGPGLSGDPPPATPFMMVAYGQTSLGIIQFVLMKGSTTVLKNPDDGGAYLDPASLANYYFFTPINDTIDFSRVVQLYYTIDDTRNGKNSNYFNQYGSPGITPTGIRFFDAELIRQNLSASVYDYELIGETFKDFKNNNSYATWPTKTNVDTKNVNLFSPTFYFNELVNKTNPNETQLNVGAFYHPLLIDIDGSSSIIDGYKNYQNDGYYHGYGPGYPININYINAPITYNSNPVTQYGIDLVTTQYQGTSYTWPGPVPLNLYNFPVSQVLDYVSGFDGDNNTDIGLSKDEQYIRNVINNICEDNPFLSCSCNDNNNCVNTDHTYFQQNNNSVQAGIANYLIYQFIPFEQIKTPSSFIITDPMNLGNTGYTYVTLPSGPLGPTEVSPTGFTPAGGPTGSYPIQSNILIDTTGGPSGPTGTAQSNNSVIQGWINNPQNLGYQCDRETTNTGMCGFLDYYDALFGISYSPGTCGGTGNNSPFQKGGCTGTQICVPNFEFLKNYSSQVQQAFICVEGSTGVSYDNLSNYYTAVPPARNTKPALIGQYNQNPFIAKDNTTPASGVNYWFWIGIVIGIIVLIVVVILLIKNFKAKAPNYSNFNRVGF